MGVVHNGHYIFCHEFLHDNIDTDVYITNANLPLRHELISTGGQAKCKLICSTVISEGGYDPIGITFSASCGSVSKSVSNANETYLLAIRIKSTRSRTMVIPTNFSIVNTDNSPSIYYLRLFRASTDPLVGATWTDVHSNSAVQVTTSNVAYDTTSAITVSQGYYVSKSDVQINIDNIFSGFLQLTSNIDGISDILVLSALSVANNNQSTFASIQWKEVY